MDANQLKEILQVLKDFDLGQIKLKINDMEIECQFQTEQVAKPARKPVVQSLFPEQNYARAVLTQEITQEELDALNLAGVNPAGKLTDEAIQERVLSNLKKHKVKS